MSKRKDRSDDDRAQRLSEWAESDGFDVPESARITRGAGAAAEGRALIEAALGSPEAVEEALGRGRRDLSGTMRRGGSPKRQVRLPIELDRALSERAEREQRNVSEIIRDALDAYLRAS